MSARYHKGTDRIAERVDKDTSKSREIRRSDELRRYPERLELRDVPQHRLLRERFKERDAPHRIFAAPYVNGFEKSGLMTNQDARKYLETRFPDHHINNIDMSSVRYEDRHIAGKDGVKEGSWERRQMLKNTSIFHRDIVIYRQNPDGNFDREEMKRTLAHEVGHQVYDVYPNEMENMSLKRDWEKISGNRPGDQCVSEYARNNKYEDFAESYRAYIEDPELLKKTSMQKYEFMKNKVFKGKEYT